MLAADWALGIFLDNGNYSLYSKGYITFDNNEELAKLAYDQSIYYSDSLDFTPISTDNTNEIKAILKSGNRKSIEGAIQEYGASRVQAVAINCREELSVAVINMLEGMLKIQLIIDGSNDDAE